MEHCIVDPQGRKITSLAEHIESKVSFEQMVNHDLTTLYVIARAVLPKDIIGALLYADFYDPADEEIANAKSLIESNRFRVNQQPDGLWHEGEDDVRRVSADNL